MWMYNLGSNFRDADIVPLISNLKYAGIFMVIKPCDKIVIVATYSAGHLCSAVYAFHWLHSSVYLFLLTLCIFMHFFCIMFLLHGFKYPYNLV